ncbi:hypothetical protein EC601_06070 [Helicobacter pylori]|nr:hypothetical protein EC601_06070 [Helicobacter pylori]
MASFYLIQAVFKRLFLSLLEYLGLVLIKYRLLKPHLKTLTLFRFFNLKLVLKGWVVLILI